MDIIKHSKSRFEYTVELNEEAPLHCDMSRELKEMLQRSIEKGSESDERSNSTERHYNSESENSNSSDYVYVLEPDVQINKQLNNEQKSKVGNEHTIKNGSDNQMKTEVSGVMDLSVGSKKRKGGLQNVLTNVTKTKTVNNNTEKTDRNEYYDNYDIQPSKLRIVEEHELCVTQDETKLDYSRKAEPKPVIQQNGHQSQIEQPVICESVPPFPKPINTPVGSTGRKNRRKSSVPVRCEKVEETSDIKEIVEEYGVQPLMEAERKLEQPFVKSVSDGPLDLTPQSRTPTPESMSKSALIADPGSPIDLTRKSKPVDTSPVNATPDIAQPVDLSKPASTSSSPLLNGFMNGLPISPMVPNMMPFDPVQMQQYFENMSKIQAQFSNQNVMQHQLLQFHALMQNAMLKGGMLGVNPLGGLHGLKNREVVKNDKNDNVIKTEYKTGKDTSVEEIQKFNLMTLQKNGLIQSSIAPQMNGLIPNEYLMPSQAHLFKGKQGRKKNNKSPVSSESSPESPKLESCPSLIDFEGDCDQEKVLDKMRTYFPSVPIENMTKSQLAEDPNPIKFYVKDNEQIRVIVDSLVQVGVLDLSEQDVLQNEPLTFKYICRVCRQTFFHMEHLTRHIKKMHVQKKYQCGECDRSFHDAGNYRQHMRVHDENDVPYECPDCHRRFRHKCTLKVHLRIHTGEKPFKCEICSATFKISSGLQTHMRKHTGETPYACEFCDLRFKCQSNLKQHLFQHTQVRPFPCDICGKTYSRKSIRDAHLLTHAKEMVKSEMSELQQPLSMGGID